MTMFVFGELVIETLCCGRQLPLSRTVLTVWSIGGAAIHTFRCKDSEACEAAEAAKLAEASEPVWKVLAN